MCDKKEFSNKNIKYNITGYENSLSDITFIYKQERATTIKSEKIN